MQGCLTGINKRQKEENGVSVAPLNQLRFSLTSRLLFKINVCHIKSRKPNARNARIPLPPLIRFMYILRLHDLLRICVKNKLC